jgi:hypothetical protein
VNVLKPNQQATVYTLLERSTTQREIARITGIDRKTVRSYQRRWLAQANSPGVATGPEALASQTPPPWPPATAPVGAAAATSLCEPHRAFIEAQLLLKRNAVAICQALIYPALDLRAGSASYERVQRDALLTERTMRWFIEQYAPHSRQRLDWRASPLLASSLKGVAPALMLTMAHDPLCDEGLAYAKRLDQEGVRVTALHLNDQFHGLLGHGGAIPAGQVMTGFVADWLGHELHRAP